MSTAMTTAAQTMPLRRTGIGVVGDVPWGTHFFMFHETKEDLFDILGPFFKAGLENSELCVWIISEPLKEEAACASLAEGIPGFDRYWDHGDIEILRGREWYMTADELDLDRVSQSWNNKMNHAGKRLRRAAYKRGYRLA